MSDTTRPSTAERSPLPRLLWRGSSSATPSAAEIVGASDLPPQLRTIVLDVVRRTGGGRAERAEIAAELVAHFQDALRANITPEAAAAAFGDVPRAAKLLRRAMLRKRGAAWQAWWWTSRSIAALLVLVIALYALLVARFYWSAPNIAVDYVAQVRSLMPRGESDERAWPTYRDALRPLRAAEEAWATSPLPASPRFTRENLTLASDRGETWDAAEQALAANAGALDAIRAASRQPALGIVFGEFDDADRAYFADGGMPVGVQYEDLWQSPLPHCGEIQRVARWIACDARHAAARGDGARAVEDIETLIRIAQQARGTFMGEQLVSLAILALAADVTQELLDRYPTAFDRDASARLARALDSAASDDLRLSFDAERLMLRDLEQRIYSDDGSGDGRLLHTALPIARSMSTIDRSRSDRTTALIAPALTLVAPSRREFRAQIERELDASARLADRPAWTWTNEDLAATQALDEPMRHSLALAGLESLLQNSGYWRLSIPPMTRLHIDVARLATAAHRYRLDHGTWPTSTSALIPTYLPAPPIDLYDGETLRLSLVDGAPVIWSVGPDRHDDGMAPLSAADWNIYRWAPPPKPVGADRPPVARGDLRLWPQQHDGSGTQVDPAQ